MIMRLSFRVLGCLCCLGFFGSAPVKAIEMIGDWGLVTDTFDRSACSISKLEDGKWLSIKFSGARGEVEITSQSSDWFDAGEFEGRAFAFFAPSNLRFGGEGRLITTTSGGTFWVSGLSPVILHNIRSERLIRLSVQDASFATQFTLTGSSAAVRGLEACVEQRMSGL